MLQGSRKSFLTTQTTGRYYSRPHTPPKKKQCAKVTTVSPLHGRRHQKHTVKSSQWPFQEAKLEVTRYIQIFSVLMSGLCRVYPQFSIALLYATVPPV